jgi:cytidylate kinase
MKNRVICIGRQFGSGGHDIGLMLAKKLNIPFFDKNLIELASDRSGLSREMLERGEERKTSQWLYAGMTNANGMTMNSLPPTEITFALQRDIIVDAAKEGDCVIVGRCSDVILKSIDVKVLSVFIAAPFEDRVQRKMEIEKLDEKTTSALVRKTDRRRKSYYNYNTGLDWGAPDNYDLCINSSSVGIEQAVKMLAELYEKM